MTKDFMSALTGIGIATAALLGSSAVQAQDASIRYRPYELTTAAGAQVVFERIQRSAKRACRKDFSPVRRFAAKCQADLAGKMVATIGHPRLTALLMAPPAVQLASRTR